MFSEWQDIGEALAQRRQGDANDIEAVVQILPEPALGNPLGQVPVRGRNDADIDRCRSSTDRHDDLVLKYTQDLGLHGGRHVADLVKQQSAAVRLTESTGPIGRCAGERALDVPEQLAFEKVCRNGRAVYRDEWLFLAPSVVMQRPGDHFLTGAGLTQHQHCRVAVGGKADCLLNAPHRLAGADQRVSLAPIFVNETRSSCRRKHALQESVEIVASDRLREMIEGAEPHGLDRVFCAGESGEDHDRWPLRNLAQPAQHFDAIHLRQVQVEQNGVHGFTLELGERLLSGRCAQGAMAEASDGLGEALAQGLVVVDDQDGCHGSSTSNNAPWAAGNRRASPPWARAISRTMARPRPVPSGRPVTKGSNR